MLRLRIKKFLLLFSFIILSLCVSSQTIFFCDTTGLFAVNNSPIHFKCPYYYNFLTSKEDTVVNINSQHRVKGDIVIRASVESKALDGPIYYYLGDTALFMQGFMKHGKADSTFIGYHIYLANYKRESFKSNFRNGLKNGEETEYNDKGTIIFIRNFKNGVLDGAYKQFDDFGNVLSQGIYKDGKKEETWKEANPETRVIVYQNFKDDVLINYVWTSTYPNGKTFIEGTCDKDGKKQGIFKIYDENGMLRSTESYKNGKRNGYFTDYLDGKTVRKTKYHNDMIVN
jgi:antitoxin component YwqK of YwqJK toxin-antitoxin module